METFSRFVYVVVTVVKSIYLRMILRYPLTFFVLHYHFQAIDENC